MTTSLLGKNFKTVRSWRPQNAQKQLLQSFNIVYTSNKIRKQLLRVRIQWNQTLEVIFLAKTASVSEVFWNFCPIAICNIYWIIPFLYAIFMYLKSIWYLYHLLPFIITLFKLDLSRFFLASEGGVVIGKQRCLHHSCWTWS